MLIASCNRLVRITIDINSSIVCSMYICDANRVPFGSSKSNLLMVFLEMGVQDNALNGKLLFISSEHFISFPCNSQQDNCEGRRREK